MLKPRFLPCLTLALASFLIPGRSSPADNWIEVRSPHFTVNTNAGEKEARKIADQFEQIRQMFHSAFGALRVDPRSEEHTSELQSRLHLVCRLLLEKKT